MRYYSHNNPSLTASFSEALLGSLASDGGLWMPDNLPRLSAREQSKFSQLPFAELAVRLARKFLDDRFSQTDIEEICFDAYDFDLPIRSTRCAPLGGGSRDYVLELTHGPTYAFKDFAARFMARAVSRILGQSGERRTILVATSGDTGGAVGAAFAGQPRVEVYILYPNDGISRIQKSQLRIVGAADGNVHALAVDGSFDDCQSLVKAAFQDRELSSTFQLMSANSINIGRVVPQIFYFYWAALRLNAACAKPLTIAVPSGNLGNLTGGLMALKMGAPISRFVAGHNVNDPFVEYLNTGTYRPRASVSTLSNAMDIGRPNNFARIMALFGGDLDAVRQVCWGASFADLETEKHLRAVYDESGYIMCPHTAIGHAAAQAYKEQIRDDGTFLTIATAHPAKFVDDVERIIDARIAIPPSLAAALATRDEKTKIEPELASIRAVLEARTKL